MKKHINMIQWFKTILFAGLILVTACSDRPDGDDTYFPLQEGLTWRYKVTTTYPDSDASEILTIQTLGKVTVENKSNFVRRTSNGIDYYINIDETGIYREALRTLVELKPRPDISKRYVLKQPFQVGTNWSDVTRPVVLMRVFPNKGLASTAQIPISYQIKSIDEEVTVHAGKFEHCIKVEGEGVTEIYTDGVNGYSEIPFKIEEWYAPNVGLVKQIRHELDGGTINVVDTPVFVGGRRTLELISFEE